ncbi:MAG: hypothetical protein KGS46_03390 [Chloroflexi bacterium]|nr:hypothetical protein [Chloroflexota bacterium]
MSVLVQSKVVQEPTKTRPVYHSTYNLCATVTYAHYHYAKAACANCKVVGYKC